MILITDIPEDIAENLKKRTDEQLSVARINLIHWAKEAALASEATEQFDKLLVFIDDEMARRIAEKK